MAAPDHRPLKGFRMNWHDIVTVAFIGVLLVLWLFILPRMGLG